MTRQVEKTKNLLLHVVPQRGRFACRAISPIAILLSVIFAMAPQVVVAQGSSEDYARSASYRERTRNRVFRTDVRPIWIDSESRKFWYQIKTSKDTLEYILVDADKKSRTNAFNQDALAKSLSKETGQRIDANRMRLTSLSFQQDLSEATFRFAGKKWTYRLPKGPLRSLDTVAGKENDERKSDLQPLERIRRSRSSSDEASIRIENRLDETLEVFWVTSSGDRVSYGKIARNKTFSSRSFVGHAWVVMDSGRQPVAAFVVEANAEYAVIDDETPKPKPNRQRGDSRKPSNKKQSPNGKWSVSFKSNGVALRNADTGESTQFADVATDGHRYDGRVWWSPDSKHFVVMKTHDVVERRINMVDSAPENSIHAELKSIVYVKPGDELDQSRPVLFHVDSDETVSINDKHFDNAFNIRDLAWHDDSTSFSFVYNQRGHQVLRVISVDTETGNARVMIDETSDTFVCYSQKQFLHRLDETNEAIWMSERSGWNHLYLIDQESGEVKNAITSGDWVVRKVERVDAKNRKLWLQVGGIDADQDPYHVHLIRVDFDGNNLTRLTRGDGHHRWEFSPNEKLIFDSYSRVDLPPVTELRDADTGELICELEKADASQLTKQGWRAPERFVSKGRDGETDIFGLIIRPTSFDANKKYPVLEAIYAGPHSAFVPKSFGTHASLYEMAELGFIVVKIDGMGTNHRSKAFHDVCWKNLGDSGFPDRIAWMKTAAKDRPEMDLSRVGIWGGSAGGQSAMRALIAHNDFYKAAVADCGCHDNRVDKIWWNEQWMGWPIGEHYAQQSNVSQAHRVKGDLMLIWGELDTNVDPASTTQVIDALVKANVDFEQLLMPGVGHGAAGHPYAKRRQADFFVRKLLGREPRHRLDE